MVKEKIIKEIRNAGINFINIKKMPELHNLNLSVSQIKYLIKYFLNLNDWKSSRYVYENLIDEISIEDRIQVILDYFKRKNHFDHEDIIQLFYYNSNIKNIDIIVDNISNPPQYFIEVNREDVYLDKCLRALINQPYPECFYALHKISSTTNNKETKERAIWLIKNWDKRNDPSK